MRTKSVNYTEVSLMLLQVMAVHEKEIYGGQLHPFGALVSLFTVDELLYDRNAQNVLADAMHWLKQAGYSPASKQKQRVQAVERAIRLMER